MSQNSGKEETVDCAVDELRVRIGKEADGEQDMPEQGRDKGGGKYYEGNRSVIAQLNAAAFGFLDVYSGEDI